MDGNVENYFRVTEQLKQVESKYRDLKWWKTLEGDFIIQGRLAFHAEAEGYKVEDAFDIKISVPADYPCSAPRVWETALRIPKNFHKNSDLSLCVGTRIEIDNAVSSDNSLIEFVEQVLIKYLFSFSVWEKTGRLPFGERNHGPKGILEFYQAYFAVKDLESAKRLLQYMSKRYSRKKWCPCRSGRRIQNCHGGKIKKLIEVSNRERFVADFTDCKCV